MCVGGERRAGRVSSGERTEVARLQSSFGAESCGKDGYLRVRVIGLWGVLLGDSALVARRRVLSR